MSDILQYKDLVEIMKHKFKMKIFSNEKFQVFVKPLHDLKIIRGKIIPPSINQHDPGLLGIEDKEVFGHVHIVTFEKISFTGCLIFSLKDSEQLVYDFCLSAAYMLPENLWEI